MKKGEKGRDKSRFDRETETKIFKQLTHKTFKQVAKDFGVEGKDKNISAVIANIAKKIRKAPDLWGLSKDTVEVVQAALDSRSINKNPKLRAEIALVEESFKDRLSTIRDKTAGILEKKLKSYEKKGGHRDISVRDLKDLLSMAIDKSRLLNDESTENIKKMSPMNVDDLKPEEALSIILKAREVLLDNK